MTAVRFSRRLWAALALLPLADTVFAYLVFVVWWSADTAIRPDAPNPVAWAIATGLVGLVMTLVGALPALSAQMARGSVSFARLVGAGALLGNAPFVLVIVTLALPAAVVRYFDGTLSSHLAGFSEVIPGVLRSVAFGSALGAWSGVFVWLVGFSPIQQE
jgi:hypothetical protein